MSFDPSADDAPFDDDAPEADLPTDADVLLHYEAIEAQNRLWIRAITPILQIRPPDAPHNGRLHFAYDRLQVAACERLARILSSDLPPVDD